MLSARIDKTGRRHQGRTFEVINDKQLTLQPRHDGGYSSLYKFNQQLTVHVCGGITQGKGVSLVLFLESQKVSVAVHFTDLEKRLQWATYWFHSVKTEGRGVILLGPL